ncbi:MAG: branched-chain amino acid transaminase [Rickettsiaceae bacterium]
MSDDNCKQKTIKNYIWINGDLEEFANTQVNILTHSLHYSSGVFEGEKSYNGKIFALEKHTERLIDSAKTMHLDLQYSFNDIIDAHSAILKANNISNAYIRPLIWRGSESMNIFNKTLSTNIAIISVKSPERSIMNEYRLHISRYCKPHPNASPPQCKSTGQYNMPVVAKIEAKKQGLDDALMLDWQGYVAECTVSNIFFIKDSCIYTPIADSFLNGITRQTVIQLARKIGIEVREVRVSVEDLWSYEECFITGTALEVQPVTSIQHKSKYVEFTTDITKQIQREYWNLIGKR